MDTMILFVLAIAASLAPGGVTQSATFFVVAPNVFRVGVPEKIILNLIRISEDVENVPVKVSLSRGGSTVPFLETTRSVGPGSTESFFVTIEAQHLARNEGIFQHMTLRAESLSQTYQFSDETEILVTLQSGHVFVQTDKPIYTPNQAVMIKVMSLDQDMLPSNRTLHVEIINPSGISVKRLKETQAKQGFLSGEYRFHEHPTLGDWSVTAFYGHEFLVKSTVTFEIREYVLPTFSVSIETPKYILQGSGEVVTTISAQYVFGKPVIGRYTFQYGVMQEDGTVQELGEKQGLLNERGNAVVTLNDLNVDFGLNWFDRFENHRFHVKAIIHEAATLFSEASINTKAVFVRSPYKFSRRRMVDYFKPGVINQAKLDLTFANGDAAPAIPVQVSWTAIKSNGQEMELSGLNVDGEEDDGISNTGAQGGIVTKRRISSDTVGIRIEASTVDAQYSDNPATISFELSPEESANGHDYLIISPENSNLRNLVIGRSTNFQIHRVGLAGGEDIDLHFLCITGGKIVTQGFKRAGITAGSQDAIIHLPITIKSYMAPQMRLIAYYVTTDGSVIADSLLVDVEEKCGQNPPLSLKILPERTGPALKVYEPNRAIDVEVTAPNNSHVGLLAVDKAVYLLRNKDRMTRRKMYDRMKSYDKGCGPGGGQNTAQIFKDSGMTVLTNADLEVDVREEIGCLDEATRKRRSIAFNQNCLEPPHLKSCLDAKPASFRENFVAASLSCTRRSNILHRHCALTDEQKEAFRVCCLTPTSAGPDTGRSVGRAGDQNDAVTVREDFRETWFFDIVPMPENGVFLYQVSTPSSITEWHLTAVSLSPTQGMCVADDTTVTVFQNFFIQLHLPYSVVRLEQTEVIATIFNYGFNDIEVSVNFSVEEGLCTAENPALRRVHVESKRAASVSFIVRPVEVGEFKITVSAGGSRNMDTVRKTLLVVPQGVLTRKGRSVTLNPGRVMFNEEVTTPSPDNSLDQGRTVFGNGRQYEQMSISLPEDSIPDTESCSVKLIGNLLGTIATDPISGLEHLVRQPIGCGEQTMIRLAPTLFVYQYLQAVGSDTADLEGRIYDYISDGVARELTYKQDNGAYAAWKHRPGSTWLTAFVVKVFSQASQFTRVQPRHVEQSINWLIDNNQLESGAFVENHQVIHQEMIGAVKGETSMTAFVLISLLESRNLLVPENEKIRSAILDATAFLVDQVGGINRVYDKAIVAYALALSKSASASVAISNLWADRYEDDNGAVSFAPNASNYRDGSKPFWLTRRSAAIDVEISAYALLAQLAMRDYQKASRIALWLSKQQNYDGGFVSTQDTVVALQALAKYTERPEFNDIDMHCELATTQRAQGLSPALASYHIGNDNAKIQEEVDASPSIGHNLTISTRGIGVAKANVELRYNTEKSDIDTCPFHLNVSAEEIPSENLVGQNVKGLHITVCTRYNGAGSTHMSIIDVGLYSGFKPVERNEQGMQGLREIVNGSDLISSYEAGTRSVIFYLDKIPDDEDLCFTFSAKSDVVVGNVQAAAVHVYDYYDPDKSCTIFYKPGSGSALFSTLCSDNECICSGGSLGYCNVEPCVTRNSIEELESSACGSHSGYALKIRIDAEIFKDGFRIYNFTVLSPIKTGDDGVSEHAKRQLFINAGCVCPKVKQRTLGGVFLLVGEKGLKYTTEEGEERFRYVYGPTSKLEFWPAGKRQSSAQIIQKLEEFERSMSDSACANEN